MIKVDISRIVPATAFRYLAALIPGLFFEVLVVVGNPKLAVGLVSWPRSALGFGYYTCASMALLVGFIVGNGFMLVVGLIERFMNFVYRLKKAVWKWLVRRLMLPAVSRLIREPRWGGRRWLNIAHRYLAKEIMYPFGLREVERCWHIAKDELLRKQYGIEPSSSRHMEADVWYSVLGIPTADDYRINVLAIALEAAGWCGIAAIHFAPNLYNDYFVGFLCLLIFGGLIHDWRVVKWQCDPVLVRIVKLRAALNELRNATEARGRRGIVRVEQSNEQE
jgi:hypothetical protein